MRLMSTSASGAAKRSFISGIRLWPPAMTFAGLPARPGARAPRRASLARSTRSWPGTPTLLSGGGDGPAGRAAPPPVPAGQMQHIAVPVAVGPTRASRMNGWPSTRRGGRAGAPRRVLPARPRARDGDLPRARDAPAAAARGRARRREDRGREDARPDPRRGADPAPVLRGHRRVAGALRVGLLAPAALRACAAGRRARRRTSACTSSTGRSSCSSGRC